MRSLERMAKEPGIETPTRAQLDWKRPKGFRRVGNERSCGSQVAIGHGWRYPGGCETACQSGEKIFDVDAGASEEAAINPEGPAEIVMENGYQSKDVQVRLSNGARARVLLETGSRPAQLERQE